MICECQKGWYEVFRDSLGQYANDGCQQFLRNIDLCALLVAGACQRADMSTAQRAPQNCASWAAHTCIKSSTPKMSSPLASLAALRASAAHSCEVARLTLRPWSLCPLVIVSTLPSSVVTEAEEEVPLEDRSCSSMAMICRVSESVRSEALDAALSLRG